MNDPSCQKILQCHWDHASVTKPSMDQETRETTQRRIEDWSGATVAAAG